MGGRDGMGGREGGRQGRKQQPTDMVGPVRWLKQGWRLTLGVGVELNHTSVMPCVQSVGVASGFCSPDPKPNHAWQAHPLCTAATGHSPTVNPPLSPAAAGRCPAHCWPTAWRACCCWWWPVLSAAAQHMRAQPAAARPLPLLLTALPAAPGDRPLLAGPHWSREQRRRYRRHLLPQRLRLLPRALTQTCARDTVTGFRKPPALTLSVRVWHVCVCRDGLRMSALLSRLSGSGALNPNPSAWSTRRIPHGKAGEL